MRVTLKRTSSSWWDERKYKVFIQGVQIVTLKEGESQVVEIAANPITVEAKFSWYGSKREKLFVNDGDTIEFIDNIRYSRQAPFVGVPIPILFLLYRGVETLWLRWIFATSMLAILFWVFYILFVARKRWIIIHHVKH